MPTDMPDLPDKIEDAHKEIIRQWGEIKELKVRAEQTVGGFLERNGKSIIAIILGVIAALGGLNYFQSDKNSKKLDEGLGTQQQIANKLDPDQEGTVAHRVNEVGVAADEIKYELKRKKGPFGE